MSSLSQVQVEQIENITKHENADSLELLQLTNGFTVIDKIGKFKKGEKLGYCPVDMCHKDPNCEEYEFLGKGRRVKGKKIRGIISCGLALKLEDQSYELSTDLSELFGFIPYEAPEPSRPGASLGKGREVKAPVQMSKYDIESIRKYHRLFNPEIVVTEKCHGCWSGYLSYDGTFYCKSRGRWLAHDGDSVWSKTATKYNLEEKCNAFPEIMICGENYGYVADLRYGHQQGEVSFAAFDAYHTKWGKFLDYQDFVNLCDTHEIPRVPEVYRGPWISLEHIQGLAEVNTKMGFDPNQIAEGVVVKMMKEMWSPSIGRFILKYPSDKFLTR